MSLKETYKILRLSIDEVTPNAPTENGISEGISGMSGLKAEFFKRFPRVRNREHPEEEVSGLNISGELQHPEHGKFFFKKYPLHRNVEAEAEKAANKIARLAGINTPPVFTLHKDEHYHTLAQPWIQGKNLALVERIMPNIWQHLDPKDIQRIALHDVHVNDYDRNTNNYRFETVRGPNGPRLVMHPLDYEWAFPTHQEQIDDYNKGFEARNPLFREYFNGKYDMPLDKELLHKRLAIAPEMLQIIKHEYGPHVLAEGKNLDAILKDIKLKNTLFKFLYNKSNATVKDLVHGIALLGHGGAAGANVFKQKSPDPNAATPQVLRGSLRSPLSSDNQLNTQLNSQPNTPINPLLDKENKGTIDMETPKSKKGTAAGSSVVIGHEHNEIGRIRLNNGKLQGSGDLKTLESLVKSMKYNQTPEQFIKTLPNRLRGYMWARSE